MVLVNLKRIVIEYPIGINRQVLTTIDLIVKAEVND